MDLPDKAIAPFVSITFGIAWGLFAAFALFPEWITQTFGPLTGRHPLFVLAVYAPAIAACGLVLQHGGASGLGRFLTRLTSCRAHVAWWAFLLLGIPAIYIAGSVIKGNLAEYALPFDSVRAALAAIGFMMVLGPVEEFGWRGVALPILQRHLAPFPASLLLGALWGAWHLPAFLVSGTPQSAWAFGPFVVGAVAISVIVTPLFNATGGSILLAMLLHFQLNNPLWPDAQPYDTVVFVLVAAVITWLNRRTMFSRNAGVTRVIPAGATREDRMDPADLSPPA